MLTLAVPVSPMVSMRGNHRGAAAAAVPGTVQPGVLPPPQSQTIPLEAPAKHAARPLGHFRALGLQPGSSPWGFGFASRVAAPVRLEKTNVARAPYCGDGRELPSPFRSSRPRAHLVGSPLAIPFPKKQRQQSLPGPPQRHGPDSAP